MDMTFFSKIFGPTLMFFGLFSIFFRDDAVKISKNFEGAYGAYWFEAVVSMIFGLAIVNGLRDWGTCWQVLLPIFGWACFIKGVLLLFFSRATHSQLWLNKTNLIMLGAIRLFFGFSFVCVGYFS
ncbi:MAG: hypothetical protein P0S95_02705 [Rhabdochlamydiaceae bacterium]|nr:hypothetical protein [Candidatus Amphrikana amoebophyrae]